ncbi:DUF1798 family protein [Virgibacillus siamensis]|uniref:DUF1798 family protein n=1 Tax=Virgibacillus siamensis TaxID=480071 RepID=UPI00098613F5|nr:DUF1798 family protein [Virgibacillus siamensis]
MDVKTKTEQLKQYLQNLKTKYEKNSPPENRKDKDFFLNVKTYTEPIYIMLDEWEEETLVLVKEKKVSLHPHQVTSTRENMGLLLMHSFYIDVKRKRYMELNHSVNFIFDQLINELNER